MDDYSNNNVSSEHMLCMAVDCKAVATKHVMCTVIMEKDGEKVTDTIRFCREHYLMQMAYQYANEDEKHA